MNLPPSRRPLIAWALYFSVLFNVVCCGLGHGQMLGLGLNSIGGGFCTTSTDTSALENKGIALMSDNSGVGQYVCPCCVANFLSVLFLIGLAGLLSRVSRRRFFRDLRFEPPPRYSWPSANPRASPR
ncbi:DUF2946 family protein [Pseudomonas sp. SBB6]|uniref:DUF2946 family protein n=1 Tax=Pseudomonas sp. SBB6 TaxID=2962032 RepID=UPI0020B85296|nr:DUF2946 family protein [Pseudomonas sp. SBB6]MCP3750487.1 DUF2946 domain-containing protein [Pseudomonas sp. SBB6]